MIKNIIFDLDGLLADTERLHIKAYQQTVAEYGIDLSVEKYQAHWIRDGLGIKEFIEEFNIPLTVEELHLKKHARFVEFMKTDLKEMPFAAACLKKLTSHFRLFLASNSYAKNVNVIIRQLNMEQYFEAVATREDVTHRKPAPDIFLYLTEKSDFNPEETVVIEDAQKGIEAAYTAKMKSIAVPNIYTKDNDFSKADRIVESLDDITIELIRQL